MKLSPKTVDIFKAFNAINSSILIQPNRIPRWVDLKGPSVIGARSFTSKVVAFARIEEIFDRDISIYDGGKFLTALSLFKDPEIDIDDTSATIRGGDSSLNFVFCDPEMIKYPPAEWPSKPVYADDTFVLHNNHVIEVLKAAGVLSVSDIIIEGDGTSVRVTAMDIKNPSSHKYETVIDNFSVKFKVRLSKDILKLFPANYNVSVVEGTSTKPLRLTNDDFEIYLCPQGDKE